MIYGAYSPKVTLGATWREDITFVQSNGVPLDLTGAHVVAHLHAVMPARDAGSPSPAPTLELTTPGFRAEPPAFPSFEGWSIPVPESGRILLAVPPGELWVVSPANRRAKMRWSVMAIVGGEVIPIVQGRALFMPNTTVLS